MQDVNELKGEPVAESVGSNILVYDRNESAIALIKQIAKDSNLISPPKEAWDILNHVRHLNFGESDVCAVFLSEEKDENGFSGFEVAKVIQRVRSCIPIFMRLEEGRSINDLDMDQKSLIVGCYTTSEPEQLEKYAKRFIYGFYFPHALVDIFVRSGKEVLTSTFKGCEVRESKPFLAYDHYINTEYTSLLPVQFGFGNGILAFLMKDEDAAVLIGNGHTPLLSEQTQDKHVNQLVSEILNLFWGRVRLASENIYRESETRKLVNIPMVVNHKKNYINFGSMTPQLCFRFILIRDVSIPEPYVLEFKIMFSSTLQADNFVVKETPDNDQDIGGAFESF